jgi:hypothetical protein
VGIGNREWVVGVCAVLCSAASLVVDMRPG